MSVTNEILKARLDKKVTQLDKLNINLDKMLDDNIDTYKLDTGVGNQMVKQRTIKNLQDAITKLEKDIDSICARLNGNGLTVITFRRRGICNTH